MRNAIARLDAWLRRHRPRYHAALRPGAADGEIGRAERELGLALPPELRALHGWRDGQGRDEGEGILYGYRLMSLDDVVGCVRAMNERLLAGDLELPGWWSRSWIPFLHNGAGDHICVDTGGCFGGRPGQVLEFWHDMESRTIVAPDAATWLSAVIASFEAGLWRVDGVDFEPFDDDAFDRFLAGRIPGYPIERDATEDLAANIAGIYRTHR
jgi:cell wall assembly regulator SMI1